MESSRFSYVWEKLCWPSYLCFNFQTEMWISWVPPQFAINCSSQEARRAFSYCISSLFIFHTLLYFILTFNLCQVSSLFPVEWPISWEGLKSGGNPQKSAFQIPADKREYSYFVQSWFRKKNETNQFVEGGIPLPIGFLQWQGAIYLLLKIVFIYLCRIPILNEQQYFIFYIFLSENVIVLFQT